MNIVKNFISKLQNTNIIITLIEMIKNIAKISSNTDLNDTQAHMLYHAIMNEEYKLAKTLINQGAKIEKIEPEQTTDSFWRKLLDSELLIKTLINKFSIDYNEYHDDVIHFTLLPKAVELDKFSQILFLINSGANVNVQDSMGFTPLHLACFSSNEDITKILLKNNADLNVRNVYYNTPLHCAVKVGNHSIIEILLKAGADIKAKDDRGRTPLHIVKEGLSMRLLLLYGAKINATDNELNTPLHLQTMEGNRQLIEMFVENGADLNAKNINGETPLNVMFKAHEKLLTVLKSENQHYN